MTHDLDATETALTGLLGARKWVRMPDVHFGPDTCMYRGAPADFVADISLSYAGDMQLELIEPVRGDSIYTRVSARAAVPACTTSACEPTTRRPSTPRWRTRARAAPTS